jgi:O-acetyl-ADP-ribose deacetylase (regulator of RNase III)
MSAWDQITIHEADITELEVDAIVNAANASLLGGGGVDGAIHRAAGKELLAECRMLDGCAVGNAKLTKGYNLPAKYVIHTVGPRWNGGDKGERGKLASCYRRCMELAQSNGIHSIAFPGIATGVYGYPLREAADTALATVHEYLVEHPMQIAVIMCTYDALATMIMTEAMKELRGLA